MSTTRWRRNRVDNGFEQGMDIPFIMTRCLPNLRMAKP
jgi:hypothetical protein